MISFYPIQLKEEERKHHDRRKQGCQNHPPLVRRIHTKYTSRHIKITRLNKSRSQRIVWILEELNLSYSLETYHRGADMLAPPELKEVHPLGKSPAITVETPKSPKPLVLAESGVIMEYLCDHFGGNKLVPKRYVEGNEGEIGGESEEWLRYRYFMHYVEGSLMGFLVMQLVMDSMVPPSPARPSLVFWW